MRISNSLNKINKKFTQKHHFKKRFKERVGVECSRKMYDSFLVSIHNNKNIFLYRISNRVCCFLEIIDQKKYIIVYDQIRDSLVTIIPEILFNENQKDIISNLSNKQLKKIKAGNYV